MSYLTKILGLPERKAADDVEEMPSQEEIDQAHKEGKRFWFELSGEEKRRYRRQQARAEKRQQRKGQRAYSRQRRAERVRRETVEAQMRVLQGPDTPMKANVLEALNVAHAASEREPRVREVRVPKGCDGRRARQKAKRA